MTGLTLTAENGIRYTLQRVLGRGSMATVYEAGDVAVKLLHQSNIDQPHVQARFGRELRICSTLQHPTIVRVLTWGEHDGLPFMVMERVTGTLLREHVAAGPSEPGQVRMWLIETLEGLRIAHQAGVIHRDIKPENMMITPDNHIKLMDFGVAQVKEADQLTGSNAQIGTPLYMSREHFQARTVTPASDIYSLGVVMFELLAGRHPYGDAEGWEILGRLLSKEPPDILGYCPTMAPEFATVIMGMIAPDPRHRLADASTVLTALGA